MLKNYDFVPFVLLIKYKAMHQNQLYIQPRFVTVPKTIANLIQ